LILMILVKAVGLVDWPLISSHIVRMGQSLNKKLRKKPCRMLQETWSLDGSSQPEVTH
jgi:hypothetical protein